MKSITATRFQFGNLAIRFIVTALGAFLCALLWSTEAFATQTSNVCSVPTCPGGSGTCVLSRPTPFTYACGVPEEDPQLGCVFFAAYTSEGALLDVVEQGLNNNFCTNSWTLPGWNVQPNNCSGGIDLYGDRIGNGGGPYTCTLNGTSTTTGALCYTAVQRSSPKPCASTANFFYMNNWVRRRSNSCPLGTSWNGSVCVLSGVMPDKQNCCSGGTNTGVGYPVDPMTGNKFLTETDYTDPSGRNWLTLHRTYNSLQTTVGGYPSWRLGPGWRHSFDRSVQVLGNATLTQAFVTRGDGRLLIFTKTTTGTYVGDLDAPEIFRDALAGSNAVYQFVDADDTVENYDADGKLLSITTRDGFATNLLYDAADRLSSVTDPNGRMLIFNYNALGDATIASITLPDQTTVSYTYLNGNLRDVTYSNADYVEYTYSTPGALLTDVSHNGAAYTHYIYGGTGGTKVISTSLVGANSTYSAFTYQTSGNTLTTTFTTPLGQTETYTATVMFQKAKLTSTSGPCPMCGVGNIAAKTYDTAGYPQSQTDFNGQTTTYTYDDARGLETQRVEASGKPEQRITNTVWNSNFRVPNQRDILDASGTETTTKWTYNARGQVLSRCEVDPSVSGASSYICGSSTNAPAGIRQWKYSYCDAVGSGCPLVGLLLSVDGPRTDVSDVTTNSYYQTTNESGCATLGGVCHHLGDPYQATNALGQIITYVNYDKNGHVARVLDANGVYTDMTYSPRGWLSTRTVRANANGTPNTSLDATTQFQYDDLGNVTQIQTPDLAGNTTYTYDGAHRLTKISDNFGNYIQYTLDVAGNRTRETRNDSSNNLWYAMNRSYSQLNRLYQVLNNSNAAQQTFPTADGYDGNGNATHSIDGNNVQTQNSYDALNRLVKVLQDYQGTSPSTANASTQYAYDARDNLRSVTDPDRLVTNYTYDGLNNLTNLSSPDTGSATYTYDGAGNRKTQLDARGITTTYMYDALNRLTGISYPTTSLNVAYHYDQANTTTGCTTSYPLGRLTSMTDSSGSTTYCYDLRGNVLSKKQITNGTTLTASYTYSLSDRILTMTYPTGAIVTYGRDADGRIVLVTYKANATASSITVIAGVTYYAYGPAYGTFWGNGRTLAKAYHSDGHFYAVTGNSATGLHIYYDPDVMGNILDASTSSGLSPPTVSYKYDNLYRLTETDVGTTVGETYTYNKTGDRLSKTPQGQSTQVYAYTPGTHRVSSVAGVARTYDANGNTTYTGSATLTYDDRNRMSSAHAMAYNYNGRGERVSGPAGLYTYDEGGHMLGEYTSTGGLGAQYIYMDGVVVGLVYVNANVVYYVETDELGSPRQVILPGATTANDTIAWSWDYFAANSAFGENAQNRVSASMYLRFPGQHYDNETGLHYNYFRDYEPGTGRYTEPDKVLDTVPRGLFPYTSSNPLTRYDSFGLFDISTPGQYLPYLCMYGGDCYPDPPLPGSNYVKCLAKCKAEWTIPCYVFALGVGVGAGAVDAACTEPAAPLTGIPVSASVFSWTFRGCNILVAGNDCKKRCKKCKTGECDQ